MATLLEQIANIQDLIDKLEAIGFGDENTNVSFNGQTRSSLAKQFKERFNALQAMVQGRLTFETKAQLDAYTPTADANGQYPLAEVWGDTDENNGLYGYSGSAWVGNGYDPRVYTQNALTGIERPARLNLPAFSDANGVELLGFESDGGACFKVSQYVISQIEQLIDIAPALLPVGISSWVGNLPKIADANGLELLSFDDDGAINVRLSAWVMRQIASGISIPDQYDPVTNGLLPSADIACWGDSMTAGAGGDGTTITTTIASELGRTVYNGGIGGQRSDQIAARQGGLPITVNVSGGEIPASGAVSVTDKSVNILYSSGSFTGSAQGTISGVHGTMTTDSSGNWTFTRTTAGAAETVADGTQFILDIPPAHRSKTVVIWSGRNDPKTTRAEVIYIRDNIIAMAEYLAPKIKNYVVVSICNGGAYEGIGTSGYNYITECNRELQEYFGDRFIDLRKYMVERAIYDAGITPTTQDLDDMAADGIPESLRYDGVHFIGTGYEMAGKFIARNIKSRGF